MNGYLQRLASQAANPHGNVRPLVNPFTGPLTAAARVESLYEGPLEETGYTSVDQPKRIPRKMQTPPEETGQESGKGRARDARARAAQESEQRSSFQPLLRGTEEVSSPRTDQAAKVHSLGQESSREEFLSDNAHDGGPLEIVVKEGAHERVAKDLTRSWTVRPPSPGESPVHQANPHFLRNSMSTSRGADEIQINIGRIEVTATPQATPRAAPPVRQAINLEEYLRRRNGRNG